MNYGLFGFTSIVYISRVFASGASSGEHQSSQMQKLQISQCREERCVQIIADQAFVSLSGDSLTAKDARIKVITKEPKKNLNALQNYNCKNFHFDMRTQFLICDNTGTVAASFTMESDLVLDSY
jgi:hypothetical protein